MLLNMYKYIFLPKSKIMKLIFVTNNQHKLAEIQAILKDKFSILSLKDIGFRGDIAETSDTIEGNSLQKTKFIFDKYQRDCFGDDTGLRIEALNGAPGVYSARFAGENASYEENMYKVLKEMKAKTNRNASFVTVITLFLDGKMYQFKGEVTGKITAEPVGTNGFGYDPIFLPDGLSKTYAQLNDSQKNAISHRALATQKLIAFLSSFIHTKTQ